MTFVLTRIVDAALGRGESAITVPAMDGALRANRRLDEAAERHAVDRPSGIISSADGIVVGSADELRRLDGRGAWTVIHKADEAISCVGNAADGIAIGLESGAVEIVGGRYGGRKFAPSAGARCPVAIAATDDNLYVCHGSATNAPAAWQRDLIERNASGSLWRLDLASGNRHRLADRLAFPAGIVADRDTLLVCESWRHRILRLNRATGKAIDVPLGDLPGYPGQLARDGQSGYLLSVFAPRSQLVEFVLRETRFKRRMLAEIDPPYWVAPTYRAGRSFYEPLQGGGVKQLGILKPWAPTLSFGMLVRLDENCLPLESFQSRADGRTHGIVGAVRHGGDVYAVSCGNGVAVRLAHLPAQGAGDA